LFCYSAVLVTPYAVTDDYVHLAAAIKHGHFSFDVSIARGCPTSGVISWFGFLAADSLDAMQYLRAVGVIGIGLLAFALYAALVRAGWQRGRSAALALLICTTPPFQVCAAWAVTFTAFYSCALTALASRQVQVGVDRDESSKRLALRLAAAVGVLAVVVSMSQISVMFFVVFAVIDLFRPDGLPVRFARRLLLHAVALGAALVIGFVMFKIGLAAYPLEKLGLERSSLVSDY